MHSTGGKVFILLLDLCAFSCTLLTLFSISFISRFTVSYAKIYVLYSHILMHSSSRLFKFCTEVVSIMALCSYSTGGVPGVVHASNSLI
jgi:hypothetical protein